MSPRALGFLVVISLAAGCRGSQEPRAERPFRLGSFPNITHAQALVGQAEGTFERAFGERKVRMIQFPAGPPAMEALIAGSLDASYVGAGPALNAYVRAGRELRIIAGAASGGVVFVTRNARTPAELKGKRLAVPQVGGTQDISLRFWLKANGLSADAGRGEVAVLNLASTDMLMLMAKGQIEGAWVPEPWGARLIAEGGARLFLDERELWPEGHFPSTVLVTTRKVIERRPEEVKALLRAHLELTERWRSDPGGFSQAVGSAFERVTGQALAPEVLQEAFSRLEPTLDPLPAALATLARHAKELGYLPSDEVGGLVDDTPLRGLVESNQRPLRSR